MESNGKLKIKDISERKPPSREYEHVYSDFFDMKEMVRASKERWKRSNMEGLLKSGMSEEQASEIVGDFPKDLEGYLEESIAQIINETISQEKEKVFLYRNYTKENCRKLQDKYSTQLQIYIRECEKLEDKMKEYDKIVDNYDDLDVESEEKIALDSLYQEWCNANAMREKYSIMLEEYKELEKNAK